MPPPPADPVPIPLWRPYEWEGNLAALVGAGALLWAARNWRVANTLRQAATRWAAAAAAEDSSSDSG